jgi:hypothetical protein
LRIGVSAPALADHEGAPHMSTTIRLSCHHAHDVDGHIPDVGDKVDCPTCPAKANGNPSVRTVKAVVTVNPTGDPDVDAALVKLGDDIASAVQADAEVVSLAQARVDRYQRARDAAANGGDPTAVLSEPLPEAPPGTPGARRSNWRDSYATRLRWVNGHRADALRAVVRQAGPVAENLGKALTEAIETGKPLYFTDATLAITLDVLPGICEDEDDPAHKAACRLLAYLRKATADQE